MRMRNIGPKSIQLLKEVGITSVKDLQDLGAVEAYIRLKMRFPDVTHNMLWALYAGLQNRDWRSLDATERKLLLMQAAEFKN